MATSMEVDLQSPQFRSLRAMSKRARSPGSPSPGERNTKRLSLATPNAGPSRQATVETSIIAPFPSHIARRITDDSWVAQTQDLSIDTSSRQIMLVANSQGPTQYFTPVDTGSSDAYMGGIGNDSADGSIPICVDLRRAAFATSHTEPDPSWQQHPQLSLKTSLLNSESTNNTHSLNEPPTLENPALPDINIHPATPSESTPSIQMHFENTPTADSLSLPSRLAPGGQRRRRTLVMGPRADCEKCRQRLPGHWMHFD